MIWKEHQDLSPGSVFRVAIPIKTDVTGKAMVLRVRTKDGKILMDYTLYPDGAHPNAIFASDSIPRKFGAEETLTVEETFQKGLGHEKFGELREAMQAYHAALSKDKGFTPVPPAPRTSGAGAHEAFGID